MTVPHPPDETPAQLRAALRRNHPELTDDEVDVILGGEPARRRPTLRVDAQWYSGKITRGRRRSVSRGHGIHRRGRRRR